MNKKKQPLFRVFILLISLIFSVKLYAQPAFTTAFGTTTIGPGGVSTLTYTIDNTAQSTGVSGVTFSNFLPTGVTIANPSNAITTCINGYFTATPGSNSVAFTDYRLGSGNSCTLTLDVTSSTSGTHTNTTSALATSAGSVSAASASLTVDASRPGFSAAFSPASITPGATSTLTYTIDNSANGSDARLVKFTNTLPTGLTISSAPNTATTCQNPVQTLANPEENAISSTIFSVTMGETCTVSVDVTANTAGTYLNTTGELSQNGRNPSGVATAELTVANPFIYAAFPTSVSPGTSVQLAFTISNNIDRSNAATDITFTNDLNATLSGLTATALPADGFCGSGSTLTGSSTLTIAGANLISGSSCSFEVTVLIPANAAAGTYTNTSSTVNLISGSTTTQPAISHNLVVKKAPILTAIFIDDPVSAGDDVTLRYTLTNTDTTNEASAIAFTEEIESVVSGVAIKTFPAANSCGSGSTFVSSTNDGSIYFFDVKKAKLAAGDSCSFDVILTMPADASPGSYAHSTSLISASVNGETVYGAAATDNLVITAAPKLSFAIVETSAIPGATVTAEFTLNYSENAPADATAVGFSLDLENVLTGLTSSTATQNDICGTGSSVSGTSILTFSGGSLSPDTRCTFSVTLQVPAGATPGLITAVSSAITATTSGSSVKSAAASDSLTITGLTLAKSFIGSPALPGSALTLRYTISNAASASTATDIQLKDYLHKALPGLAATSLPSSPCGPSSALSGTTSLTFSGGELAPGESCTFDIPILAPSGASSGLYNSATEAMYATINGNNTITPAASATLSIEQLTVYLSTTASSPTSDSLIQVKIDFSRDVINFVAGDLVIGNGSTSNFAGSGKSYTADITPTADGSVTIDLPADMVDDAISGTVKNPAATQLSLQFSATSAIATPSLTISAPSQTKINTGPITYTVTYTDAENVNLTSNHITLNKTGTNATITVTNGSTNTPTVTLSDISGDGSLGISIGASSARNDINSAPAVGPSTAFTVDNTKASISITDTVAAAVNTSYTATFTFSEDVTGFEQSDISVTNASLSSFSASNAKVYTATVTPNNNGEVTLNVAGDAAADSVNNGNTAATQYSVTYDTSKPTLSISASSVPINTPFTATLTFNKGVTGLAQADIIATNASLSNFVSTSALIYTVTVTPTADGTVTLNVAADIAQDSATNGNTAATQYSVLYETSKPTVTISASSVPVNAPFTATFTLSEAVTGFTLADIIVANGSASNFAGSANVYTATITPAADGLVNVDVAADVAKDSAGNNNSAATQYNVTYDATVPTLVISSDTANPTNTSFTATFTLSEAFTGFALADITVTNGHASNFTGSGSVYTATITPTVDGVVSVDVAADVAQDSAGNNNSAATQYSVSYDVTVATLVISSDASTPTNTSFTATFTFSEAVTGFASADIVVANGSASNFAGSDSIYTATITPSASGAMSVDVAADVAQDSAGNNNSAATQYSITSDVTQPTVTISGSGVPVNAPFIVTFTFSEAVTGFALADISVTNGHASNFAGSGSVYTATIIPTADGVVNIDVAADIAQDSAGNNNSAATQYSVTYDVTVPTLVITSNANTPTNASFTATFIFSETVTGFALADISIANGHASNFAGSGSVYTATITPTTEGLVSFDVAADIAQDSAGNNNSAASQYSVTYDVTVPTLVISSNTSNFTNTSVTATFTFSETVTSFALADITVANGSASNFAGSGSVYTVTITPAAEGVVNVDVAANVAQDSVGNNNSAASQYSITYDITQPTITISGSSVPVNAPFTATFTLSEAISGFTLIDITVTNGHASNFAGSGSVYTATINPTADGVVNVDVAADVAQDSTGNNNSAATQYTVNYDHTVPTLVINSDANNPTNISFTATFTLSEAVTNFALADITVTNGHASNFAGSGSVYTATITPTADGVVNIDVAADVTQDSAGNNNSAATQYSVTYDVTVPTLVITSNASNATNTSFTATFTLSEAVTGFALTDITVANGYASNFAGSGSVYTATITPTTDGVISVDVAADVAQDSAGNNNSTATQYTVTYDVIVPTLVISSDAANPTNTSVTTTFTFSEAVNGFALADITVTNGHASNFTSSGSVYTATIIPAADGVVNIDVAADVAQDSAGNNNRAASQYSITSDITQPTITISGSAVPINAPFTATLTLSEVVTGFALADITVTNGHASNFVGSGSVYTVTITPIENGVVNIDVAADVTQDSAGNNNSAATQYNVTYDATVPTLVITSNASTPTKAGFTATFTFSEAVTGFALADITVVNGHASNLAGSANVYTATITPTTDGVVSVDVAADVTQDSAGNNNSAATQYSVTYDATVPTLVISSDTANPTNTSFTATFTFSETVSGFALTDITVANGSASNFAGNGRVYTATMTPAENGVVSVDVAADAAQDSAGNNNSAATQYTINYDATVPTLVISSDAATLTNTSFTATFTLSETVIGFALGDITVTNGSASNFAGSGSVYTVLITPAANGAVTVDVSADVAQDSAGNNNNAATQYSVTYDVTVPTLVISSDAANDTNTNFTATFTLSEAVTDFVLADITVTNGHASNFAGSGSVYTVTITPSANGVVSVDVAAGVAQDSAGNNNSAATQYTINYDHTVPTLVISSDTANPTNTSFTATFTFSEAVNDFVLTDITVTNGHASNFAASGSVYTATITPAEDGVVSIDVPADVAQDSAGNNNAASQYSVTYDATVPTLVISSDTSNPTNSSFTTTLTFSEAVTDFVLTDIIVTNGSASNFAGSGSVYTATITPAADGVVSVDVAADVAQDSASNNNSAATQYSVTYDVTQPTVNISGSAVPVNAPFTATFTFSEAVSGFALADITVTNGHASNFASNGSVYTVTITPSANGVVSVNVAADVAQDSAGNNNSAATQYTINYDHTVPTLVISSDASNATNSSFTATFTLSEAITGFALTDISVANGHASNFTGSGSLYTATITPTADGIVSVDVAANVAQDSAGNNNSAASQYTINHDQTVPTLVINSNATNPTNASFTASFTFSEAVTGFTLTDINVANASASNFASNGNAYTATITPSTLGVVSVDVAASVAQDSASNNNSAATQYTVNYDPTVPTLVISSNASTITNTSFIATFTFSEAVTGFALADITVANGSASNLSASGNVYSATITPAADGVVSVDVPANVAINLAGNNNATALQYAINYDATMPTLVISSDAINPTNASFTAAFTFSEAVTDFFLADIILVNATASNFAGSGSVYTATITPIADGVASVDVAANVAQDSASNNNSAALQYTVDYDVTLPTVTLSSDATPQSITGFTLTITFSEEVSGFTIDDISLSSGNLSTLTQEGAVYTALVTPEVEIIDISIDVLAGVAQDASGNDNSVAAALEIHLDNTAPKLVSSSPSHQNTEVIINDLTILLNFNEAIELQTNFGVIELVDLSDNTIAESLDLASSSPQVTINNNTATLDFNNTLIPDRQYGLRVSDTVFADIYANAFSGLSESQLIFITVNNAPVTTSDEASVDEDGSVAIAVLDNDSDSEGFLTASSVTVVDKSTNGQTSVNTANGVITYTPAADFNGSDSFSYEVSDFQGATSAVTQVIVTINAQNDLPVLANDLQVTEEDMTVIINVLANDTDIDDSLNSNSLVLVTEPVNGEAQVIDGQISYTPVADFNGSDSFTYRVADSTGAFGEAATVTLNISGSNDAPVAIDDAITTNEDTGVTLNVLTNDSDIDSELDATSISIITSAQHGAINIDAVTGDILYTPNEHFNGSDHFGYVVKDSFDATSNEATVKITVISVNDAPVANDDIVVLQEDILHLINVLGNDTDVEQGIDASTVTLVSQPEQGQVSLDSQSGKFSYTPAANFFGDDSFSYRVEDSEGGLSNIANVRLTVQSVNDLPIVNPDSFIIAEDSDSNLAILANDADIDGVLDTSTLAIITTVAHGELVDNNDGTVNYTPVSNYVGNDSFSYSVADNEGGVSNEVEVTISITSVNDAPEFTSDAITQVDEDNLYSYSIVAVDIDTQDISISDNLTITGKLPQWLNLTDNSDGSALLTGTPDNSQVGDHVISLMVTDSGNITDIQVFTLVVNNINDAPIADNIALTLDEDTQVSITPTASDADLNNLTFSAQTQPLNGQLDTGGEQWIYTPNANFHGVDGFSYIAKDDISRSEVATISIEVRSVNDLPLTQNDFSRLDENTSVSINLLDNDSDVDGNIASIDIIEQPASGELLINPDNSILYTPAFSFDGNISFSYRVIDELGGSSAIALVNITVTNINTAPTISGNPQTSVLSGDEYNFMPSVEDLDGDTLRFTISNKPDWTSFDKATGALTGQPNNNNVANYTNIVISVTDTTTETASLTAFNIEVLSLDKTPVADAQQITVLEDSLATITLTGTDPNDDSLRYILINQPINGILSGSLPELTYTPNENYAGTDSLSFSVTDGEYTSQEQTISIVVTQMNDAPLAENDTISVIEGQSALIDPLANDSDIDGDELTLVNATAGRGSVTIEDNKLSYQAIANFVGETQVSYTITDNMGETAQASVIINLLVDPLLLDPPVVIAPQELILNATALYTRVNLGVANATDRFGNPLPVFLDGTPFYQPGINFAVWKTEDASGRTASAKQKVNIHPLISLGNNQTVTEGDLVTVEVLLNGESPVYPLTIPYTVSGSAGEELDYDLSDGFIVIEAGTRGEISFNILTDEDSNEGDEDIIITLDTSLNLGSKIIHRVLIAEQNIAPTLTLNAMQNNINTLTAAQNNGLVTVNLSIFDPNTDDNHNIDWNDSNRALVNQSSDELSFIFDPSNLTIGLYRVNVKITDDLGLSDSGYISIKVIAALQTLTTTDSDGDGIPDNEEGYQDEDNDGIPDYQDAIAVNNVLPAKGNNQQQFLVEGDPGVNLQLGDKALLSDNAGIQIEATDLILDENAKNVGGIFDFIANGLPEPGQSYNIVFPQQRAIPRGAILRKHSEDELGGQHWRGFTEITDTDMIRSTKGERGFCPPPGNNSKWLPGLTEGDWCIQITLRDGGPNDDDGLENGVIIDPVAMAVPVSNNNFPEPIDDSINITKNSSQVIIKVLDNDLDVDGDTLSLTSVNADLGIVEIQGESLLYTPPADFIGNDRLVYSIRDGSGGSAAAIVTILVLDYNQLPQALDDNASGNDATGITIDVLANDTDADGDALFIESASTSQGSVQVVDNELYYQPELGHIGSVRIEYVVNDGQGGLGGAALRLDIIQSNRAPDAKNDSATTTDRDSIIINVLSNDTDSDNDDLTLIDAIAQYGVASIDNNQLVYQPKLGFDGTDMVSYRISDGRGGESSSNVNITVTAYKTVKVKNSSGGSMGVLLIIILAFICTGRRRIIHR